jgi:hypothetical protein
MVADVFCGRSLGLAKEGQNSRAGAAVIGQPDGQADHPRIGANGGEHFQTTRFRRFGRFTEEFFRPAKYPCHPPAFPVAQEMLEARIEQSGIVGIIAPRLLEQPARLRQVHGGRHAPVGEKDRMLFHFSQSANPTCFAWRQRQRSQQVNIAGGGKLVPFGRAMMTQGIQGATGIDTTAVEGNQPGVVEKSGLREGFHRVFENRTIIGIRQ